MACQFHLSVNQTSRNQSLSSGTHILRIDTYTFDLLIYPYLSWSSSMLYILLQTPIIRQFRRINIQTTHLKVQQESFNSTLQRAKYKLRLVLGKLDPHPTTILSNLVTSITTYYVKSVSFTCKMCKNKSSQNLEHPQKKYTSQRQLCPCENTREVSHTPHRGVNGQGLYLMDDNFRVSVHVYTKCRVSLGASQYRRLLSSYLSTYQSTYHISYLPIIHTSCIYRQAQMLL